MSVSHLPSPTSDVPSSEGEVLVRCEYVSKKFCRSLKKSLWYGVQDIASELNPFSKSHEDNKSTITHLSSPHSSSLREDEFWAVKDVSFELRRGECLALLGRNGAGKTTLLKMLNGLIKPDFGTIEIRGRVAALIALGAGFNPILTGRENIYINGSVLGLSRQEITEKIDDIIDFADIHDFIDAPVQSYSSGMQVRLGFAVATALEPDVLFLDEVLAVGDAAFRAKCYNRIVSMRKQAAVIFVTHSMEQVSRICDSTILMRKGSVEFHGDVTGGVRAYDSLNELGHEQDESFLRMESPIQGFSISGVDNQVQSGKSTTIALQITATAPLDDFRIRFSFYSISGGIVAEINHRSEHFGVRIKRGENWHSLTLANVPLRAGRYKLGCNVIDPDGDLLVWSYKQYEMTVVGGEYQANTECQITLNDWAVSTEFSH